MDALTLRQLQDFVAQCRKGTHNDSFSGRDLLLVEGTSRRKRKASIAATGMQDVILSPQHFTTVCKQHRAIYSCQDIRLLVGCILHVGSSVLPVVNDQCSLIPYIYHGPLVQAIKWLYVEGSNTPDALHASRSSVQWPHIPYGVGLKPYKAEGEPVIPQVPQQTTPRQPLYKTHSDFFRPTYPPQGGSRPMSGQAVGRPSLGIRKIQPGIPSIPMAPDKKMSTLSLGPSARTHTAERIPLQTQGSSTVPVIPNLTYPAAVVSSAVNQTNQQQLLGVLPGNTSRDVLKFNLNKLKVNDMVCPSGGYMV